MYQVVCVSLISLVMTVCMHVLIRKTCRPVVAFLGWLGFVLYLLGNLYFTVISRVPGTGFHLELRPFHTYADLWVTKAGNLYNVTGFAEYFLRDASPTTSLILNILLYYPLGYFLPILFPKLKPKHVILIGCLFSIATEATQYLLKIGWCETDDVIHNTLGTALGVWIWHLQSKRLNKHKPNELPKE